MAKKSKPDTTQSAPSASMAGPLDAPFATLEYTGPVGQVSPVLGPLSVGSRYQVNVQFADYLVEQHPDFWTRPSAS